MNRLPLLIPSCIFVFLVLTVLTQVGGVLAIIGAVIGKRFLRFHGGIAVGVLGIYSLGLLTVPLISKPLGREALPWGPTDSLPLRARNIGYCLMFRNFVTPELAEMLRETSNRLHQKHPDLVLDYLDACFPFIDGMPLLPHLSHSDGRKIDLTFSYRKADGQPSRSPSPIGYWVYEGPKEGEKSACKDSFLRWDFPWLQGMNRDRKFAPEVTRDILREMAEHPKTQKILLEPHLKTRLGLTSTKIRFQGCHAARHDDHLHLQID